MLPTLVFKYANAILSFPLIFPCKRYKGSVSTFDQKIKELEEIAKAHPLTQRENFIYKKTISKMKAKKLQIEGLKA